MPEQRKYIFGSDPGGNGAHGLALIEVSSREDGYECIDLPVLQNCATVQALVQVVANTVQEGSILASGIDTLTAWNRSQSGWRPADTMLRDHYPVVANSVASSNSIFGSMSINGALILRWLSERADRGGLVTEAHPKVCFYARHGGQFRHPWSGQAVPPAADQQTAKLWLLDQLGLPQALVNQFGGTDHTFDAMLGCLAALRGLNGDWPTDLHQPPAQEDVHPFGQTHYWWPEAIE